MKHLQALLQRDFQLALRQGSFGTALGFLLCLIVLVPLSLGPDQALLSKIAPGIMWLGLLLAVLLTADRIFQQDFEDGSLELMTLSTPPFELICLTKSLSHWLNVALPLAILSPALGLMLNINVGDLPRTFVAMIIGSLSLSLLASIGGAVTAGLRRGGLLVSLLVLPLYIPVLIFGLSSSTPSLGPDSGFTALMILLATTLVTLAIAPIACAAALKAYLR